MKCQTYFKFYKKKKKKKKKISIINLSSVEFAKRDEITDMYMYATPEILWKAEYFSPLVIPWL